jgi:glycosyltransferase involved in cell wall biosynthesis
MTTASSNCFTADVLNRANAKGLPHSRTPHVYVATLHRPWGTLGGIQTHVHLFTAAARQREIAVDVLSPFYAPVPLVYTLFGAGKALKLITKAGHAWWYDLSHGYLLRWVMRGVSANRRNIIYAQDPISAEAALQLRDRGFPVEVVLAVHENRSRAHEWVGLGAIAPGGRLYRSMLRRDARVVPRVDRLIFVSQFMENDTLERIPAAARVPRWVIPNSGVAALDANDKALSAELITIGTLEPRKNQEFLLRVLAHARNMGASYRLTIVGDGILRRRLSSLAKELGVAGLVSFRGAVSNAATLLSEHLVYVHAAKIENLGIALIEALASGKPILAAPVGGVAEVFRDGVEGMYWNLDDPEGAARLLIRVLNEPGLYRRLSEAGRDRYLQSFTPEVIMKRLIAAVLGSTTYSTGPQDVMQT